MLDAVYEDIYGVAYYVDASYVAHAKNISIYLSTGPNFMPSGVVCVANLTFANTGTAPNLANCTNTIANARYVTVIKYIFSGSDQL